MWYHDYLTGEYFNQDGIPLNEEKHPIETIDYAKLQTEDEKHMFLKTFEFIKKKHKYSLINSWNIKKNKNR